MQNVDLGHTKVMQIRQRETLSHQGVITHEVCCCTAQLEKNPALIFGQKIIIPVTVVHWSALAIVGSA